jgi:hypothetical protein
VAAWEVKADASLETDAAKQKDGDADNAIVKPRINPQLQERESSLMFDDVSLFSEALHHHPN